MTTKTQKQNVYQISEDFGRGFSIDGVFLATPAEVKALVGRNVYFGEICGKHSEIDLDIGPDTITLVSDVRSEVDLIRRLGLCRGQNPVASYRTHAEHADPNNEYEEAVADLEAEAV